MIHKYSCCQTVDQPVNQSTQESFCQEFLWTWSTSRSKNLKSFGCDRACIHTLLNFWQGFLRIQGVRFLPTQDENLEINWHDLLLFRNNLCFLWFRFLFSWIGSSPAWSWAFANFCFSSSLTFFTCASSASALNCSNWHAPLTVKGSQRRIRCSSLQRLGLWSLTQKEPTKHANLWIRFLPPPRANQKLGQRHGPNCQHPKSNRPAPKNHNVEHEMALDYIFRFLFHVSFWDVQFKKNKKRHEYGMTKAYLK